MPPIAFLIIKNITRLINIKIGIFLSPYLTFPLPIMPTIKEPSIQLVIIKVIAKLTTNFVDMLTSERLNGRSTPGV